MLAFKLGMNSGDFFVKVDAGNDQIATASRVHRFFRSGDLFEGPRN